MNKADAKLVKAIRAVIVEITETEHECAYSSRLCTGCKWNRRIRRLLKSALLRLEDKP